VLSHPVIAHAGAADETLSVVLLFAGLWVGWVGWSRLKDRGFPRLPRVGAIALVAAGVALALSAAVVPRALFPRTTPGRIATDPGGPRPASSADVSFAEPTSAEQVRGDELDVVLNLTGGRIVDAASTNLAPDTGHIHLSLDGTLVSMTFGLVQAIDLRGVPAGRHLLEAEYVAADHGPFDPRVIAKVEFETGGDP
jgi:hypothetical protein